MSGSHRPLRVLHLTAGSDAGGLSRYIYDLGSAMIAQGHEVAVGGERGAWHWLFERGPMPWIDLPLKGSPIALWKASHTLRKWLDEHHVDVLHTHYRRATLVARRVQRDHDRPILYTLHLSDLSLKWPWRLFSDFGDHTHVASEESRRWVVDDARVPAERVTVVHHGLDVAKFPIADDAARAAARKSFAIADDALVACFVGRLDYPKNVDWLIDVAERVPNLHMLIAGEGPDEVPLMARIRGLPLHERIHHKHRVDPPLPIYQASDLLLLPSLREGFSFVNAEAMCVGVPVLRTRTAGAQELIIENETGRSTPIDKLAFVSAAVEMLSLPKSELRRMGAAAAVHVRNHFTFQKQLDETLALYRRIATLPPW